MNMQSEKPVMTQGVKRAFDILGKSLFETQYKRTSRFFIELSKNKSQIINNPKKYDQDRQLNKLSFKQDIKRQLDHTLTIQTINQINLQCSGHGVFYKMKLARVFLQYLDQIFQYQGKQVFIQKVKLNISGFRLNSSKQLYELKRQALIAKHPQLTPVFIQKDHMKDQYNGDFDFIHQMRKIIIQKISQLKSLQIRINDVEYCTKQDLSNLISIGLYKHEQKMNNNLNNLVIQISNWRFYQIKNQQKPKQQKDKKKQVNESSMDLKLKTVKKVQKQKFIILQQLQQSVLNQLIVKNDNKIELPNLKRFRLQLSTICYQQESYNVFKSSIKENDYKDGNKNPKYKLKNKKVINQTQYLHYKIIQSIKTFIISTAPNLNKLQLDFRNWYKDFDMKSLKQELVNINRKYQIQQLKMDQKKQQFSKKSENYNNNQNKQAFNIVLQFFLKKETSLQLNTLQSNKENKQTGHVNIVVVV